MYRPVRQNQFKKDYKRYRHSIKDIAKIKKVIGLLIHGNELLPKYKDHNLHGECQKYRECHVRPDLILIYKKENNLIYFIRLGSHSEIYS